jgi:hypothetical protein
MIMEAARTSEMLINFYQTTWCYNPEDSRLHTHHHENLKSYLSLRTFSNSTSRNLKQFINSFGFLALLENSKNIVDPNFPR